MTREGQGKGPEDGERPLASTRWSEPGAGRDNELLPPFVPGRGRPRPAPGPEQDTPDPVPDWAVADLEFPESAVEAQVSDHDEAVADAGTTVTGPEDAVLEAIEPDPLARPDGDEEVFFPFDDPGAWDDPFPFAPDEPEGAVGAPLLPGEEATGMRADEERGEVEAPPADPWAAAGPPAEGRAADDLAAGPASELADRLEDLAARIRADGKSAARAAMASDDRLTALLATLLAGYLEGREE